MSETEKKTKFVAEIVELAGLLWDNDMNKKDFNKRSAEILAEHKTKTKKAKTKTPSRDEVYLNNLKITEKELQDKLKEIKAKKQAVVEKLKAK